MPNAVIDQLVRETLAQDAPNARVDQLVREALVILPTSNAVVDQLVREGLVRDAPNAIVDQLLREGLVTDTPHARIDQIVRESVIPVAPPVAPNMPIIYPLTIPNALGESKADLTKFDAIGEFISDFTGSAEQQQWTDQHWELMLEWPEMNWPQFAAYDAFTGALHGKLGSFLWGPPLATTPRGVPSGSPILAATFPTYPYGAVAAGIDSIPTTGWTVSRGNLLLPGDFLQIGPAALPITSVQIISGVLGVYVSNPSAIDLLVLEGLPATFSGATSATWLNGAILTIAGFLTSGSTIVGFTFTTLPANAPSAYVNASDTGAVTAAPARLYQYVDSVPLSSDSSGNALIPIFPNLREPLLGAPLSFSNPQGTFRLADNRRTSSADERKLLKLKLKCREAI